MSEPLSTITENNGWTDRGTSPCCYADMPNVNPGKADCPECGRLIICTRVEQPVCRAELAETEEAEYDENF